MLAQGGGPLDASPLSDLRGLSSERLLRMATAARDVVECHRVLAKTQDNIVGELLRACPEFHEWEHFPPDDAYDGDTHAQYYYHAHPPADRSWTEHGHFHTFLRANGMPEGVEPLERSRGDNGQSNEPLSHLVAISMDRFGLPIRLFTTSRWVTNETWYPAKDVIRMVERFAIDHARPSRVVNRWITGMFRLFEPQIQVLLVERDRCVAARQKAHPGGAVLEDRQLEVTSWLSISLQDHIARLDELLTARGLDDEVHQ